MWNHYKKELISIAIVFGLIGYSMYVCAAEPVKAKPVAVKKAEPAKKEVAKPVAKKEATKPTEPKKDPNRKKPTCLLYTSPSPRDS